MQALGCAGSSGHCLHCDVCSLLHRLPPLERGRWPIINEVQPDMHPLEILADVKKLMNVQYVCRRALLHYDRSRTYDPH